MPKAIVKAYDMEDFIKNVETYNEKDIPTWLIKPHKTFWDTQIHELKEQKPTKVILIPHLLKQDFYSPGNAARYASEAILYLQDYFSKNLPGCTVVCDLFWRSDLDADTPPGTSYQLARETYYAGKKHVHSQAVQDNSFLTFLYTHAHRAKLISQEDLEFEFLSFDTLKLQKLTAYLLEKNGRILDVFPIDLKITNIADGTSQLITSKGGYDANYYLTVKYITAKVSTPPLQMDTLEELKNFYDRYKPKMIGVIPSNASRPTNLDQDNFIDVLLRILVKAKASPFQAQSNYVNAQDLVSKNQIPSYILDRSTWLNFVKSIASETPWQDDSIFSVVQAEKPTGVQQIIDLPGDVSFQRAVDIANERIEEANTSWNSIWQSVVKSDKPGFFYQLIVDIGKALTEEARAKILIEFFDKNPNFKSSLLTKEIFPGTEHTYAEELERKELKQFKHV